MTDLISDPLVTVVTPQALLKAIVNVEESEHDPDQVPDVGQLQLAVHVTTLGFNVQLRAVKLSTTVIPPPLTVRELRPALVIAIGADVDVVTSKTTLPELVVNLRLIPVFSKVIELIFPIFLIFCPVLTALTAKLAPRRPDIEKFGIRLTKSFVAGIVQVAAPVPEKLSVTVPFITPVVPTEQPDRFLIFCPDAQVEKATVLQAAAFAFG